MAQLLRLLVSLADSLNLVSTTNTVASKPPLTVATELLVYSTSFCWHQAHTWCAFYTQAKFIHVK